MSDEEVMNHPLTGALDGRWHPQTKALLNRFVTQKLQLNNAWALTWYRWSCPCCRREKKDIARLTASGILLCQLDRHHDHLRNAVEDILKQLSKVNLGDSNGRSRSAARNAIYTLSERFTETLVCNDCNAADAAMKKHIGKCVPRHFSFAPSEIARFINRSANASHKLNAERGEEEFEVAILEYEDRLTFATSLAGRVVQGLHDTEHVLQEDARHREDRDLVYRLISAKVDVQLSSALLARSCSKDGIGSA